MDPIIKSSEISTTTPEEQQPAHLRTDRTQKTDTESEKRNRWSDDEQRKMIYFKVINEECVLESMDTIYSMHSSNGHVGLSEDESDDDEDDDDVFLDGLPPEPPKYVPPHRRNCGEEIGNSAPPTTEDLGLLQRSEIEKLLFSPTQEFLCFEFDSGIVKDAGQPISSNSYELQYNYSNLSSSS